MGVDVGVGAHTCLLNQKRVSSPVDARMPRYRQVQDQAGAVNSSTSGKHLTEAGQTVRKWCCIPSRTTYVWWIFVHALLDVYSKMAVHEHQPPMIWKGLQRREQGLLLMSLLDVLR